MQLTSMFSTALARLAGLLPQTLGVGMMGPCRLRCPGVSQPFDGAQPALVSKGVFPCELSWAATTQEAHSLLPADSCFTSEPHW